MDEQANSVVLFTCKKGCIPSYKSFVLTVLAPHLMKKARALPQVGIHFLSRCLCFTPKQRPRSRLGSLVIGHMGKALWAHWLASKEAKKRRR